jgi:hypothetical protein
VAASYRFRAGPVLVRGSGYRPQLPARCMVPLRLDADPTLAKKAGWVEIFGISRHGPARTTCAGASPSTAARDLTRTETWVAS